MAGERVVDTNVVSAFFDGERDIVERLIGATDVLVPVVVLGELQFGARAAARVEENLAKIDRILQWVTVVYPDEATAELYGVIKRQLRMIGRMIPDNDIWVAAASRRTDVKLVSRDRHFSVIEGLDLEVW